VERSASALDFPYPWRHWPPPPSTQPCSLSVCMIKTPPIFFIFKYLSSLSPHLVKKEKSWIRTTTFLSLFLTDDFLCISFLWFSASIHVGLSALLLPCVAQETGKKKGIIIITEKGLTHTHTAEQSRERKAKKGENERNEEEKDTHTQKSMLLPLLLLRLQCAKLHTNAKK
jgi:hypothetical protein